MGSGIELVGGKMDNLRLVAQLDTMACVADLAKITHGNLWGAASECEEMIDPKMPHKTLILRAQKGYTRENWFDDLKMLDLPILEKYDSFFALVVKAVEKIMFEPILSPLLDFTAPMGRMVISILAPHSVMAWHIDAGDYAKRHIRFHVPLVTNTSAMLYCGQQAAHIPTGILTCLNVLEQHSAGNWGDIPRAHLIFELRRKQNESARHIN